VITRRGWALLGGGAALAVSGRLLGIEELYILAAAAVVLVVAAAWQVRAAPLRLDAHRQVHPTRVHAGTDSRVELAVRNAGGRRTPVLTVRDPFDQGRRQARFLLAPLRPGETARAAYRLPTDRRGVYTLGPLEVNRTDAFGLATATTQLAAATQLTVFPRVDTITPMPHTIGHDPYAGADHPNALGQLGEDFYALRPYVMGDDLRRVHWKSTARVDDLMIRQDEMPWQGRVTVLLDARRKANTDASLELVVSAAASIVSAGWRRRSLVRLVTTDGFDSGFAAGSSHAEAVMEHLATIRASRHDRLASVLAGLRRSGNGGALAAVTATTRPADVDAVARLRGRFGAVTVVGFEPSAYDPSAPRREVPDGTGPAGMNLVRVTGAVPFAEAWNRAVTRSPLVTRR
jgi:uncharacterized protein (DUF58 family)